MSVEDGQHPTRAMIAASPRARLDPRWPRLAREAFHGLAGRLVEAIDPYTEADPVATLAHTLAAVGNLIGPGPHARVQHDRHPCRLNVALVGRTGKGRKGTAWSTPRHLLAQVDPVWAARRVTTGLSSGEGLVYHVRDARQESLPVRERGRVVGHEDGRGGRRRAGQAPPGDRARARRRAAGHRARGEHPLGPDSPGVGRRRPRDAHEAQPPPSHRRPREPHRPHHRGGGAALPHRDRAGQRLRQPVPLAPRPAVQGAPRRRAGPRCGPRPAPRRAPPGRGVLGDRGRARPRRGSARAVARGLPGAQRGRARDGRGHPQPGRGPGPPALDPVRRPGSLRGDPRRRTSAPRSRSGTTPSGARAGSSAGASACPSRTSSSRRSERGGRSPRPPSPGSSAATGPRRSSTRRSTFSATSDWWCDEPIRPGVDRSPCGWHVRNAKQAKQANKGARHAACFASFA